MSGQAALLTGASGFIGSRVQALLLEQNVAVRALLRPDSPHRNRIAPACAVITAEFSDHEQLLKACDGADAVIYCAGAVRGRTPDDFRAANIDGVSALTRALNRSRNRTPFLLISSLAASRPDVSDYARSKHLGEQALMTEAEFPWTIFRPPAVYGPGDREMLPLLKSARRGLVLRPGPANQRLSLLYVDDLARAVLAWLEAWPRCENRCFTLDDGREGGYDWPAIARAAGGGRALQLGISSVLLSSAAHANRFVSGVLGYAPMLTPGKVRELTQETWLCDNSALTKATGWIPTTDLAAGLRRLFDGA
jgi:nucleoside-diphosphate-sugar epimerase